jgi:hypothetical protein
MITSHANYSFKHPYFGVKMDIKANGKAIKEFEEWAEKIFGLKGFVLRSLSFDMVSKMTDDRYPGLKAFLGHQFELINQENGIY